MGFKVGGTQPREGLRLAWNSEDSQGRSLTLGGKHGMSGDERPGSWTECNHPIPNN